MMDIIEIKALHWVYAKFPDLKCGNYEDFVGAVHQRMAQMMGWC